MKIPSLLNPKSPDASTRRVRSTRRHSTEAVKQSNHDVKPFKYSSLRRSREIKDAPKYEEGEPIGTVLYPPYEAVDEDLRKEYERFSISPRDHIADYPRNIPYSSEKKKFHVKTGRDCFNGMAKQWTPSHLLT